MYVPIVEDLRMLALEHPDGLMLEFIARLTIAWLLNIDFTLFIVRAGHACGIQCQGDTEFFEEMMFIQEAQSSSS